MWDLHIMSWASLKVIYWGSQRCVQAIISDHLIISLYNTVLQWRSFKTLHNTLFVVANLQYPSWNSHIFSGLFRWLCFLLTLLSSNLPPSQPWKPRAIISFSCLHFFQTNSQIRFFHHISSNKKKTPLTYSLQENKPGHYQYRMPVELSQSSIPG